MQGEASSDQCAILRVYVGIDVCKAWLDVHVHPVGRSLRVPNTGAGWKQLRRLLREWQVALVMMEATGKYHRQAHRDLHAHGFAVAIINPLRPRLFAEALGTLAKNDRIDAKMLAVMGESIAPKAVAPCSQTLEDLQELLRARQSAVDEATALGNQLGETGNAFLKKQLGIRIRQCKAFIAKLEKELLRLIDSDAAMARRFEIVQSIPGVGAIAAAWLVIGLSELGACSGKAASLLAGLAPLDDDSADRKGHRRIRGGRADVRRGLFMAAISAVRFNPDQKAFYSRLIAKGKAHKIVVTAVMRRLVVLANTLLKEDRHWQPTAPNSA